METLVPLILTLLLGGIYPIGLLWIYVTCQRKGLIKKTNALWQLTVTQNGVLVTRNSQRSTQRLTQRLTQLSFSEISHARYAYDDGGTESKLVEDALTLFNNQGKILIKIPKSCQGFNHLMDTLPQRKIHIERIEVDAPSYMD